jgi:hypothetical protein
MENKMSKTIRRKNCNYAKWWREGWWVYWRDPEQSQREAERHEARFHTESRHYIWRHDIPDKDITNRAIRANENLQLQKIKKCTDYRDADFDNIDKYYRGMNAW